MIGPRMKIIRPRSQGRRRMYPQSALRACNGVFAPASLASGETDRGFAATSAVIWAIELLLTMLDAATRNCRGARRGDRRYKAAVRHAHYRKPMSRRQFEDCPEQPTERHVSCCLVG